MAYHRFTTDNGDKYGSFEVFHISKAEVYGGLEDGWYWQAGFPGCLPDGDPNGPFATEAEAIADANDN